MGEDFPVLTGFRVGSLLARYRLEAQVGAGGMAVVFRARDEQLGRIVALKILGPVLAADPAFRRRFIAESRAAAAVDDPHIIPVHEAGEADGVLFIAMRFVSGGDLRQVLEREGALPPVRAAEFLSPVASALDAAHAAGLVHRDVKPANILVDARVGRPDHVYLSDFGVSKRATASVSLTGTGSFLGTPDYAAPEQIQGWAVDGRADQYALACVAFQLLTGTVPFERDQGMAVLLAHLSEPPPSLGSRRQDLPEAADRVLARALAKAREKRYGSCGDFADALRAALGVAPYYHRSPVSVPDYQGTEIGSPLSGLPGPAAERTGTAVAPADPAVVATIDSGPDESPGRADQSGLAAVSTNPASPGTVSATPGVAEKGIPADATAAIPQTGKPGTADEPGRLTGEAADAGGTADAVDVRKADIAPERLMPSGQGPAPTSHAGAKLRTGRQLKRVGYLALNSRLIHNNQEVIDHLVIGPSGVYAIDSEKWQSSLVIRTREGTQLWHGPFSKKERLDHARWKAQQASDYLSAALGFHVAVRPAIAIYGPVLPWDIATVRDVDVFSGPRLRKYLRRRARTSGLPELTAKQVDSIYDAATEVLPEIPLRPSTLILAQRWLPWLALLLLATAAIIIGVVL